MKLYIVSVNLEIFAQLDHPHPSDKIQSIGALSIASVIARTFPKDLVELKCIEGLDTDSAKAIANMIDEDATHVGFSIYSWSTDLLCGVAKILKKRNPDIVLFAGGNNITYYTDTYDKMKLFDTLVVGEGELATVAIIQKWLDEETPEHIVSVSIPDLTPLDSPWIEPFADLTSPEVSWELSRGCIFNCSYCCLSWGLEDRGVRHFSLERLQKELDIFVHSNVPRIVILDPTFNYDKKRAISILDQLAEKAPDIQFVFEVRPEYIDEEFLIHLQKLKNATIRYGIQSIHPQVLTAVHRAPMDKAHLEHLHELFKKYHTDVCVDLILGLPTDTYSGFCESLDYVYTLGSRIISFTLMLPPVSHMYKDRELWGIQINPNYPNFIQSTSTMSEEDVIKATQISLICNALFQDPQYEDLTEFLHSLDLSFSKFLELLSAYMRVDAKARVGLIDPEFKDIMNNAKVLLEYLYMQQLYELSSN